MIKKLKKFSFLIIICFISLIFINEKVVNADSGWDSSYDSGGSWDSGSWDSGSWDNDSSWSGSGIYVNGDLGETDPTVIVIMLIIIIAIIIISSRKNVNHISNSTNNNHSRKIYKELTIDEIKQKDDSIDVTKLKHQAFDIYKNVQEAWMNFDNETLRKYLTDEIYNMYSSQLKTLKIKNNQNIMKDIVLKTCKITSLEIENGIEKVVVYLNVSQYDYVIDNKGKVVRGTDKYKNNMEYLITLVRHVEEKKIEKCPNCGASIDIVSGGTCPYCDSTIINNNEEFVMSKKECVGQWKEI